MFLGHYIEMYMQSHTITLKSSFLFCSIKDLKPKKFQIENKKVKSRDEFLVQVDRRAHLRDRRHAAVLQRGGRKSGQQCQRRQVESFRAHLADQKEEEENQQVQANSQVERAYLKSRAQALSFELKSTRPLIKSVSSPSC